MDYGPCSGVVTTDQEQLYVTGRSVLKPSSYTLNISARVTDKSHFRSLGSTKMFFILSKGDLGRSSPISLWRQNHFCFPNVIDDHHFLHSMHNFLYLFKRFLYQKRVKIPDIISLYFKLQFLKRRCSNPNQFLFKELK